MRGVALVAPVLIRGGAAAQQGAPPDVAAGGESFQRSCASCHNVEGRAPSLSTGVFTHGGEDAQIAQTIRAGVPGTQMPPFPALSADQIRQLVAYIRSLTPGRIPDPTPARILEPTPALTYERLRAAATEPQNWLPYWGNYQSTHYSGLSQITTSNVRRLQAAWARQLPGSSVLEATPLVIDGVMYTSGPPGTVVALNAATGQQIC